MKGRVFRRPRHGPREPLVPLKPGAHGELKKVFAGIGKPVVMPFTPDPFQLEAVAAIEDADCLVTAPTGAGKTWIAEQAIARILKTGGRVWYASPLKALTNAKYADFAKLFGADNLGILTGDRKENPEAPVTTGTTEILRNQLYDAMHLGQTLAAELVILDEAHFLGDAERGVVWEEIMIYLPQRIGLLMLSATVGNAEAIAAWLEAIRGRPCRIVSETRRPVPLVPLFFHPDGTLLPLTKTMPDTGKTRVHPKVRQFIEARKPMGPARLLPPFGSILQVLRKYDLLPAIFFLKSRADCDRALNLCLENRHKDSELTGRRRERIGQLAANTPHVAEHRQLGDVKHLGVGSHHSGQLPVWKLFLETLMTEGLLDAIFATSTVAAGVNFPARTVAFLNTDRFNGTEFMPLSSSEFHQMTGRAGRRGMDKVGFALAVPTKFMDLGLAARLVNAAPSDVVSQIKINFSMALNLLLSHEPGQIVDLLEKSLAAFQTRPGGGQRLAREFDRHLAFLTDHGYAGADGRLTDDGIWASRLRVDQPLVIAEALRRKVFPQNDPALMAAVMACFVNEQADDVHVSMKAVPKAVVKTILAVQKALKPFQKQMAAAGFATRPTYVHPAVSLYFWAQGMEWETVTGISQLAEGDLAMLILRTADHLRHLIGLTDTFPSAAASAAEAVDLIIRDPVAMAFGV